MIVILALHSLTCLTNQKKSLKVQNLRRSTSSVHGSRDELLTKLRVLKTEIDQKMEQKRMIIAELKTLTQQVVKKVS